MVDHYEVEMKQMKLFLQQALDRTKEFMEEGVDEEWQLDQLYSSFDDVRRRGTKYLVAKKALEVAKDV